MKELFIEMEGLERAVRMKITKFLALTALLFCFIVQQAGATHLRAGEITVERVSCAGLIFRITVTVYTNTASPVHFGGDGEYIDFGDGTTFPVPDIANTIRPDLGPNIGTASITVLHSYPGPGSYRVSWREPNRNEGVLNMTNSVGTTFYIETLVNIDPFLGCNNSPKLLIAPIDRACSGVAFFHNPGAYDPDGDSLSYEIVVPFKDRNETVVNYQQPNSSAFYASDFNHANEDQTGPPSFSIDPVSGTLTWNAPGIQGEYNIAFIIKEWRKKADGKSYLMGFVRRDMQIIVEDCNNDRPDVIVPNDTCVVAGTSLNSTILGIDPDNDSVKIEAFSEIFQLPFSPATYTPPGTVFQKSVPPAQLNFSWDIQCDHVKDQAYQVVFKITDKPPNGPRLTTYKTWNIKVVGPAPEWEDITPDLARRYANLEWDPYFCANATSIQVWRKIDGFDFTPDNCETGMPEFLGYTLVATLPAKDENNVQTTTYVDTNGGKGLNVGAKYCYRLVALFPLPRGGESYVSLDTCLAPFLSDAPIITNVTVDKTDISDGEITVKWRSPIGIDPVQYPGPYEYELYRATGQTGSSFTIVHPGRLSENDTVYTDGGLNTKESAFNYTVVLYSNTASDPLYSPIDTSDAASSVRLEVESHTSKIELNWSAVVPWTNITQDYPYHRIYRGPGGSEESDLELIDSVNVTMGPFEYVDQGQYNNVPLNDSEEYCYRILTRGTYGNPAIESPLENFSQIICAFPSDTIPPCKPLLEIQLADCQEFLQNVCDYNTFSNTLLWSRPDDAACRSDIRGYNIYVASSANAEFTLLATSVRDTFFIDQNLPSFARCYRISAVDQSGNESELSDPVCGENCPYFELPNVFTPGDGSGPNDYFTAFGAPKPNGGEEEVTVDDSRCLRFVLRVKFRVYNNWGKELYTYESGGERTVYINWDGRDNSGKELPSAVYFYQADVTFDMADPKLRNRIYKGWVHLIR